MGAPTDWRIKRSVSSGPHLLPLEHSGHLNDCAIWHIESMLAVVLNDNRVPLVGLLPHAGGGKSKEPPIQFELALKGLAVVVEEGEGLESCSHD